MIYEHDEYEILVLNLILEEEIEEILKEWAYNPLV